MSYQATIGLEVHAELKTKTKMFCGCKNEPHGSEPNSHVCPVCTAQPGSLPVPNKQAIQNVLLFGEAVAARTATYSEFDRKNYFYPDIPKAYQISQYKFPFLEGGELEGVKLTRVHLEEDTARSQHDKGSFSIVDFNRAGVPLMELVTEPVIHDASTAGAFARELQLLLRTLGISDANMERGEMRVEANISVSNTEGQLGTKVEVKNLNSFKSVEGAIEYEIARQTTQLENGEVVTQETRGWDEQAGKTFSQRSKETAKDYRYFPDPDIPKMDISLERAFDKSRLVEILPNLPAKSRKTYANLGIKPEAIEVLLQNQELHQIFKRLTTLEGIEDKLVKRAVNYLTTDVVAVVNDAEHSYGDFNSSAFLELMKMLEKNEINSRVAKDFISELFSSDFSPREVAEERGLLQASDPNALAELVASVIADNPQAVDEYKAGKEASLKYLIGQGMKLSKGSANPEVLAELLAESLKD